MLLRHCILAMALTWPALAAGQATLPAFEVATLRQDPGGDPAQGTWSPPNKGIFHAEHITLERLIQLAFNVDASQIANKPSWLNTDLFVLNAKPEEGIALTREELRPRLQRLLADRLHLVTHTEVRKTRGYALHTAKSGQHLTPTKGEHTPNFRIRVGHGHMEGSNWSVAFLAQQLSAVTGFPVVDETALQGSYDIAFTFAEENDPSSTLPGLESALRSATGLELHSSEVPVQTIVIDSVDRVPSAN